MVAAIYIPTNSVGGLPFLLPSLAFIIRENDNWKLEQARGEGNGTPLQYACLENPMDRGAW